MSIGATNYITNLGIITLSHYNPIIICLAILILTYIFELVSKSILYKAKQNQYIYDLILIHNHNKIRIQGYLDSGNLLIHRGKPVVILDLNSYLKLTKTTLLDFCRTKFQSIQTSTINGNNNLKLFIIDRIIIKQNKKQIILENQYIAINTSLAFKEKNYQALLSPIIM